MESIFGGASRIVQPPLSMRQHSTLTRSRSDDADDRRPIEAALTAEGIHRNIEVSDDLDRLPSNIDQVAITSDDSHKPHTPLDPPKTHESHRLNSLSPSKTMPVGNKGQAHDPLEDTLFLHIGAGGDSTFSSGDTLNADEVLIVCESPSAVEINVYEKAYQDEIERIARERSRNRGTPTLYLTRRVDDIKHIREAVHACVDEHRAQLGEHKQQVKEQWKTEGARGVASYGRQGLSKVVARAREEAGKTMEQLDRKMEERKKSKEELVAKGRKSVEDLLGKSNKPTAEDSNKTQMQTQQPQD